MRTFSFLRSLNPAVYFLLIMCLIAACGTEDSPANRPNVLLILTDDQGYGDVRIHGNDSIDTPVMDRLASEGTQLERFFVSPVCAPTRASLLTGRYHYRTGTTFVTRNGEAMRSNEATLAELFKANGYATGCFGKWHNGAHYPENPLGQGFDFFTGFCAGHWNNYNDPMLESQGTEYRAKGYITDILTDSALSFMDRSRNQPFFCYVPYNTPHTPFIAPEDLYQKYKQKGLADRVASTYGMVENIDQNMGRMVRQLEEAGELENTLIIFMTDNGPNYDRYNAGMKGRKGWVNDGGVRVPCFFYWKGKWETGRKISSLTAHIDILPTLRELLGLSPVETLPLDGTSFASLLKDTETTPADRTFFTFSNLQEKFKGAARTQEYRLTVSGEDEVALTRFEGDPGEKVDLSGEMPQLADSLYQAYLNAFEEVTKGLENFRPIPIGYPEASRVVLPAHEAFSVGNMSYKASKWGWANDWFVNWTSPADTFYWNVEAKEQVAYRAFLQYTATSEHLGAMVLIKVGSTSLATRLSTPFTPEIIPNQDQVPRKVEAYDQTWGSCPSGPSGSIPAPTK